MPTPSAVAVLFARRDSVYRSLGCDVYDEDRDARSFDFSKPVIAHPPCRAWARLSHFAKPAPHERDLALFAMWAVRVCGGVVEHPLSSRLWAMFGLQRGKADAFGGILVPVRQSDYGHLGEKWTGLYCCRVVPPLAPVLAAYPARKVEDLSRRQREATPPELAARLVDACEGAF